MRARARARLLLTLVGLLTWAQVGAETAGPIRVALGEGLRVVEVGAADQIELLDPRNHRPLFALAGPRVVRITPTASGLDVEGRHLAVPAVRLEAKRGPLRVGSRDYPGALEVWRSGDGALSLVNELALEDYVAGTVRAEASEKWPPEALRAIAVVARTYAVFHQAKNAGKMFHVVAGNQDQNFTGRAPEGSPAGEAARATAGLVLTWQGRVFPTFYHSDSGGVTEPAQAIFSGEGIAPLPGVRDEFSVDSPNYSWVATLPLGVLTERLRQGGIDVGDLRGVTVIERTPSLRVSRLQVEGPRGTATIKGTDFRRLVGYDVLRSTLWVASLQDGAVRFEGRGWGHGVGLSQFGAKGMAERGYGYAQILAHYYPGAVLEPLK
jgi:stage II sporulation protein D